MTAIDDDDILHHDHRTLRLATVTLTPENLAQYLRYLEVSLAHAEAGKLDEARLSEAHQRGLLASGLTPVDAASLGTVVRAFSGSLFAIKHLQRRKAEARERLSTGTSPSVESDEERVKRLTVELAKLEPMNHLASRYGRAAISLLQTEGDRLLALHERNQRVFAGGA